MIRNVVRSALALLVGTLVFEAAAVAQNAKSLAGRYEMELDPSQILELRANGTGSLDGEEMRWKVKGDQMTVIDEEGKPDTITWALQDDRLVLVMAGMEIAFRRTGPGVKKGGARSKHKQQAALAGEEGDETFGEGEREAAQQPAQPAGAPAGGAIVAKNDQVGQKLAQLLMSSPWCSFSYKSGTTYTGGSWGSSSSERVVFHPNGAVALGSGGESYNSGAPGSVASQRQGGGGARWKVKGEQLFIDGGQGAGFQDVGLTGSLNSNGYPILKANGKEYSQCN